jgi:hypothetical protein
MTRQRRWGGRLGSLTLSLTSLVAALLLCEIVLRLFPPEKNIHATATLGIYAPDAELGWTHKANIRRPRDWAGRTVIIRTDANGYRIPDGEAPKAGAGRIALAGDSYVFGNEVNAEETFVHLVGKSSGMTSVNLGVGAYYLSQECLALRRFMAKTTRLAHAFLVIYVGNDIEDGPYPPRRLGVDQDGYLRSTAPGRWDKAWSFALRHSRLIFYAHMTWQRIGPSTPPARKADARDTEHRWLYDEAAFTRDRFDEHRRVLTELRDDARKRRVPLTVVILPERDQVYGALSDLPNRMLSSMLTELGMPVIDLLPKMRKVAAERPPLWHDIVQGHLSVEGHQFVTEVLMNQPIWRPH